jgi:hypothetical protein
MHCRNEEGLFSADKILRRMFYFQTLRSIRL